VKRRIRQGGVPRRGLNLQIRLSEEQHRLLSRYAALQGLSTSAWARMVLLREAKSVEK
jgi:predicted HicB family RNase H-like nuclease